jgi:hypothetical protein
MNGLLPIGSVVLLTGSTKKVMIIGVLQKAVDTGVIYDYVGCVYPEGYFSADKTILFDAIQIEKMFSIGYQDEEQFAFKVKADKVREDLQAKKN